MDIQSVGGFEPMVTPVSGTTPTTMTSPPPTPALNGTLAGISQQLGMSVGSVQGAIKQGLSISDLAQQQGVSRDSLVSSIEATIKQTRQANGQPPLDQAIIDRMVTRALEHHRRPERASVAQSRLASYLATAPPDPATQPGADGDAGGFSVLA